MSTLDKATEAEMAALASGRRAVYEHLTSAFAEPPALHILAAILGNNFLSAAEPLVGEIAVSQLRRFAAITQDSEAVPDQTRREFHDLFKVPGGKYVAPYESVFRDTREMDDRPIKGLLMGRSAVDVQKWYRLAAVEVSGKFKELPDHIALELNFLAHLCGKERQFASAGDSGRLRRTWEMERDFLAAHVVSWIGALRDRIHEKSNHPYFRGVADMGVEFTKRDLASLERLLGPSNGASTPQYCEAPK